MKIYCNPLNLDYKFQYLNDTKRNNQFIVFRETADPSMIYFKNKYYIFSSMSKGVYISADLVNWKYLKLNQAYFMYDYAPDARVIGDYVYFTTSRHGNNCPFYRTKDIENGPYEKIEGKMYFWDPNLFYDDGRLYLYYGSSNKEPIYGVELDVNTLEPISPKVPLIAGDAKTKGFERVGENYQQKLGSNTLPYIEGAWMTKYQDKYYLQYGCPGTEFNTYANGVYVSNNPLGPFKLAKNNPFTLCLNGFMRGAGHGSTISDNKRFYHTSTMQISINHPFERRIGLWKAGFDQDGELYADQRFHDWPIDLDAPDFSNPPYMLLSYQKKVTTTSEGREYPKENITDENCQTYWKATTNDKQEVTVDLEEEGTINAIQINFGEIDFLQDQDPEKLKYSRYIDDKNHPYRYKLLASVDDKTYQIISDYEQIDRLYPHDFIHLEEGIKARYLKLIIYQMPFNEKACLSGIRVFGKINKDLPVAPDYEVIRTSDFDAKIIIKSESLGYNVLWGTNQNKLYHSTYTYQKEITIGALVKDENYYIRVDAFNESGITKSIIKKINCLTHCNKK